MARTSPCLLASALVFLLSTIALPRVWVVQPDGSGDASTIRAAIDSAATYDIVELADGIFTGEGNRDVYTYGRSILIRSASNNPTECVIDCEGSEAEPHIGFTWEEDG